MNNKYFFGLGTKVVPFDPTATNDILPISTGENNFSNNNYLENDPIRNINPIVKTPVEYSVTGANTFTFKTVVWDKDETLPGATVTVNGKPYATNVNGLIQLPNTPTDAEVLISYIGYKPFQAKAINVPSKVVLQSDSTMLDEVIIKPKKSNFLLWLGLGTVAAIVINKATEKPKKVTTTI